jgi:hypothetical protein
VHAGDALGATLEFSSWSAIRERIRMACVTSSAGALRMATAGGDLAMMQDISGRMRCGVWLR